LTLGQQGPIDEDETKYNKEYFELYSKFEKVDKELLNNLLYKINQ